MESMSIAWGRRGSWLLYIGVGFVMALILAAIVTPNLLRSRPAAGPVPRAQQFNTLAEVRNSAPASASLSTIAEAGTVNTIALDRRVIRKGAMEVIVDNPATALDQITAIARHHRGYVVSSELTGREQSQRGDITIRVPAAQFDEARAELKSLAKRVESEQTSADDVTMRFAENEATLRNFRAEETSYLQIMQRSGSIKETLQVAEQLSDVRGRIERLEAEIRTMALETEMTAIQVSVSSEPVAAPVQHWRPSYELRTAWNDGVDALTGYLGAMMAVLMYLPAILLWVATFAIGGKLTLMLLRLGLRLFRAAKPQVTAS